MPAPNPSQHLESQHDVRENPFLIQTLSLTASVIGNFAGFSDWRIATRASREGPGEGDDKTSADGCDRVRHMPFGADRRRLGAGHRRGLPFPTVTDPEAPPIRPERHVPNSIATIRRRLIVALARTLPRCPCCNAPIRKTRKIPDY